MAKQYLMPYTNLHELNLDWLINAMKQLEASWDGLEMKVTANVQTIVGDAAVDVTGSLKDTLNFDFKLPSGSAFPGDITPAMDTSLGYSGISQYYSRSDHSHPSDTTKLDKIEVSSSQSYFYTQDSKSTYLTPTQELVYQNQLENALAKKQNKLVSGSTIKTINNIDILSDGNINTNIEFNTLWENTSQSAFEAQTITLDLSDYSFIVITFLGNANNTSSGFASVLLPISVESKINYSFTSSDNYTALVYRTVFPQQSQITFTTGTWTQTSTNKTWESTSVIIPITIYGVK